ncbi:unnamed protein product [Protopolystoma xenopodis]|uniref:Uncharacterized protein n=1 Tax=Protopolystoma xenopodis TaxID=117903 RepID=A0A3S5A8N9_9PLAT|nr:unnamed protein product [Protopolystoma xenopodis]
MPRSFTVPNTTFGPSALAPGSFTNASFEPDHHHLQQQHPKHSICLTQTHDAGQGPLARLPCATCLPCPLQLTSFSASLSSSLCYSSSAQRSSVLSIHSIEPHAISTVPAYQTFSPQSPHSSPSQKADFQRNRMMIAQADIVQHGVSEGLSLSLSSSSLSSSHSPVSAPISAKSSCTPGPSATKEIKLSEIKMPSASSSLVIVTSDGSLARSPTHMRGDLAERRKDTNSIPSHTLSRSQLSKQASGTRKALQIGLSTRAASLLSSARDGLDDVLRLGRVQRHRPGRLRIKKRFRTRAIRSETETEEATEMDESEPTNKQTKKKEGVLALRHRREAFQSAVLFFHPARSTNQPRGTCSITEGPTRTGWSLSIEPHTLRQTVTSDSTRVDGGNLRSKTFSSHYRQTISETRPPAAFNLHQHWLNDPNPMASVSNSSPSLIGIESTGSPQSGSTSDNISAAGMDAEKDKRPSRRLTGSGQYAGVSRDKSDSGSTGNRSRDGFEGGRGGWGGGFLQRLSHKITRKQGQLSSKRS